MTEPTPSKHQELLDLYQDFEAFKSWINRLAYVEDAELFSEFLIHRDLTND